MRVATILIVGGFGLTAGCGPTCQNTCTRIYDEAECGITDPALDTTEQIKQCVDACDFALARTGEMGDYDPNKRHPTSEAETLDNEIHAAAWMDCVWATECEELHPSYGGYCAPI